MTNTDALTRLPHGPEFRFVDQLVSIEPGKSAKGVYQVRGDEPFLAGHFPGEPIMPGVITVEAVAQLAGVIAQSDPDHPPFPNLRLTAIQGAKILGTARPGETMELEATIDGRLGNLIQASGTVTVNGTVILKAKLTLSG